jgi:hypothetical protein
VLFSIIRRRRAYYFEDELEEKQETKETGSQTPEIIERSEYDIGDATIGDAFDSKQSVTTNYFAKKQAGKKQATTAAKVSEPSKAKQSGTVKPSEATQPVKTTKPEQKSTAQILEEGDNFSLSDTYAADNPLAPATTE